MATSTQYNPQVELNQRLLAAGASKTVYALVTPQTEVAKESVFGDDRAERAAYFEQFRDAWTGKQEAYHENFFDTWCEWSKPVVNMNRADFPFHYPTAGASEPLRHIIFDFAAKGGRTIHVFEGEYEGYKAMAEAAGLKVMEHTRDGREGWHTPFGGRRNRIPGRMRWSNDLFFISQPSAIDGMVWNEFNEFISKMPDNSVVVDLTYVGAVLPEAVTEKFDLTVPAVRNIVFSLSKPFGTYYDRIGGVFCRQEDLGLFGNKWFKSLTALSIGTTMMNWYDVFFMPKTYRYLQVDLTKEIGEELGLELSPADVFILATGKPDDSELGRYLRRGENTRMCLTPGMAEAIGTSGPKR